MKNVFPCMSTTTNAEQQLMPFTLIIPFHDDLAVTSITFKYVVLQLNNML